MAAFAPHRGDACRSTNKTGQAGGFRPPCYQF
jgi:hypothetical protein